MTQSTYDKILNAHHDRERKWDQEENARMERALMKPASATTFNTNAIDEIRLLALSIRRASEPGSMNYSRALRILEIVGDGDGDS